MKKYKEIFLENDLGAYLYNLRTTKGYTQEELEQKINVPNVTLKTIKKWEHDLEFPNLDQIYKLSEIYEVPSEELMQVKTQTLQNGAKGINTELVRLIGYLLGIPMYGAIVFSYIFLVVGAIGAIIFFAMQIGWVWN